jgi:hypothetical protein
MIGVIGRATENPHIRLDLDKELEGDKFSKEAVPFLLLYQRIEIRSVCSLQDTKKLISYHFLGVSSHQMPNSFRDH